MLETVEKRALVVARRKPRFRPAGRKPNNRAKAAGFRTKQIQSEFRAILQNQAFAYTATTEATMHLLRNAFLATMLFMSSVASAFTPESGTWINTAEPGSGFLIEIQDNFLFFAGYLYATDGRPMWYTSQGTLNGNARFVGSLSTFADGQCLGCIWRLPTASVGAGGPIEIIFDTEVAGRMTFGGRTIPIVRFDFYLTRTANDVKTEMFLGEWQTIIDFSANTSIGYPFYGDVWVFDVVDRAPSPDIFDGCRPFTSLEGECTNAALAEHDASGFYQASSGDHYIVVNDDATNFAYYVVKTGTYQFDGIVKICPKSLSNAITQCLGSSTYRSYPVRGFRTASRNFVQTGTGPSDTEKSVAPTTRQSLASMVAQAPEGMDNAAVKARFGIDLGQLPVKELETLTARMR